MATTGIVKYVGRIYSATIRGVEIPDSDRKIFAVYEDGSEKEIPERQDLVNHSPTGFCWGYAGSGPAQAALAICAHYYGEVFKDWKKGDEFALLQYNALKFGVMSQLSMEDDFEIDIRTVQLGAL